ncbi:hypothetical protein, partial [Nocardia xishanensis]|uniref:hypothetical protein n=1 Tax=Nocardia xishanensis TaxID=238964 RepID=UPI001C3F5804
MIKRQMFGRAKPDLLRKRILLSDSANPTASITKIVPDPDFRRKRQLTAPKDAGRQHWPSKDKRTEASDAQRPQPQRGLNNPEGATDAPEHDHLSTAV